MGIVQGSCLVICCCCYRGEKLLVSCLVGMLIVVVVVVVVESRHHYLLPCQCIGQFSTSSKPLGQSRRARHWPSRPCSAHNFELLVHSSSTSFLLDWSTDQLPSPAECSATPCSPPSVSSPHSVRLQVDDSACPAEPSGWLAARSCPAPSELPLTLRRYFPTMDGQILLLAMLQRCDSRCTLTALIALVTGPGLTTDS